MIAACLTLSLALPQGPPGKQDRPEPLPVPRGLCVFRGERKISVDGSLMDWGDLPPVDLSDKRLLSGTAPGAWRGEQDLSGAAFLMWDEDDLWVAASVKDEWHRALDAKTLQLVEIPVADSIVLTFDPDRNTRTLGPDPGRSEDAEFWLAEERSNQLVRWDRLRGTARVVDGARQVVSHDKEKGLTSYEARIPWREILPAGRKASDGMVFDLQMVINDYDESTDPMPQTRIGWTFGCGTSIDPGLSGTVMLVKDVKALQGRMPDMPPRPPVEVKALAAPQWEAFAERLRKLRPAVYAGEGTPDAASGLPRLAVLEELDRHYEAFPRVDHLEFNHRMHRRMTREVAGAVQRGLPCFWYEATKLLSQHAEAPLPEGTMRLFRVPQCGWLVLSKGGNFVIDANGPELAGLLWGKIDFALQTQPLDMTRRNDQLLIRMIAAKPQRQFLSHIVFHLPMVNMADMQVVDPGASYGPEQGLRIKALGHKQPDGSVTYSLGYSVRWPGGRTLLVAGVSLDPKEVPESGCDLCILSPRNPDAVAVARAAKAKLVVIDDAFLCSTFPAVARVSLKEAFALQRELLPIPSVLLAPGEFWDLK